MALCRRIQGTIYMIYYSYSFNVTNIVENKYIDDSTKYLWATLAESETYFREKNSNFLFCAESVYRIRPMCFSHRSSSRHNRKSCFNRVLIAYETVVWRFRVVNPTTKPRSKFFFLQHQQACDSSSDFFL